jgi:hypothetical protein
LIERTRAGEGVDVDALLRASELGDPDAVGYVDRVMVAEAYRLLVRWFCAAAREVHEDELLTCTAHHGGESDHVG